MKDMLCVLQSPENHHPVLDLAKAFPPLLGAASLEKTHCVNTECPPAGRGVCSRALSHSPQEGNVVLGGCTGVPVCLV